MDRCMSVSESMHVEVKSVYRVTHTNLSGGEYTITAPLYLSSTHSSLNAYRRILFCLYQASQFLCFYAIGSSGPS